MKQLPARSNAAETIWPRHPTSALPHHLILPTPLLSSLPLKKKLSSSASSGKPPYTPGTYEGVDARDVERLQNDLAATPDGHPLLEWLQQELEDHWHKLMHNACTQLLQHMSCARCGELPGRNVSHTLPASVREKLDEILGMAFQPVENEWQDPRLWVQCATERFQALEMEYREANDMGACWGLAEFGGDGLPQS